MPRIITRAELRQRARERADMKDSAFITDAELNSLLSRHYAVFYDLLCQSGLNYYEKRFEIAGTGEEYYDLPHDYYGMIAVDFQYTNSDYFPLVEYQPQERTRYENLDSGSRYPIAYSIIGVAPTLDSPGKDQVSFLPPLGGTQVARIRYIPAPIELDDPLATDETSINGVSGWEELIVVGAAIDMLTKEESSTAALDRKYMEIKEHIESAAQIREWANPRSIVDVEKIRDFDWWRYARNTAP